MKIDADKLDAEIEKAKENVSKRNRNIGFITDSVVVRAADTGKLGALTALRSCLVEDSNER